MAQSLLPKSYQTPLILALEIVLREFESLPVEESIKNNYINSKYKEIQEKFKWQPKSTNWIYFYIKHNRNL